MAASFLVNPVTWVADSSGEPSLTISAIPAGSNRKLVMTLTCRDTDTWNITTLTIGGQSYTSITSPAVVDSTQSITAIWDETAIAAMSGTALVYADDTFQSPQGASYYVVQDVDQDAAVVTDSGLTGQNTAEATVTTSGNTADDLVVVTGVISDDIPSFDDWDGGSLTEEQQQTLTNLTCGTAYHQGTDTSFTVGTTGSTNDVMLQAVVHKAAVTGITIAVPTGPRR